MFSPLPQVLYVDKLPVGFRDLAQFRKLFSGIVNPPYCQVRRETGYTQPELFLFIQLLRRSDYKIREITEITSPDIL